MNPFLLTIGVVCLYVLLSLSTFLQKPYKARSPCLWIGALLAAVLQAYVLYKWIDGPLGQNLTGVNLFALITWVAAVILLIGQTSMPIASLGLIVYPMAALSLVLAITWPGAFIVPTVQQPQFLFHILLSTLVVALFVISGCQAGLLALQEYLLRHKKLTGLLDRLPPLQEMEILLFRLIKIGVLVLTLLLLSSFSLFGDNPLPGLWSKISLTFGIWLVFVGLLVGRHFFGWRANTAAIWTAIGVVLAIMVYLGSRFLLQI